MDRVCCWWLLPDCDYPWLFNRSSTRRVAVGCSGCVSLLWKGVALAFSPGTQIPKLNLPRLIRSKPMKESDIGNRAPLVTRRLLHALSLFFAWRHQSNTTSPPIVRHLVSWSLVSFSTNLGGCRAEILPRRSIILVSQCRQDVGRATGAEPGRFLGRREFLSAM